MTLAGKFYLSLGCRLVPTYRIFSILYFYYLPFSELYLKGLLHNICSCKQTQNLSLTEDKYVIQLIKQKRYIYETASVCPIKCPYWFVCTSGQLGLFESINCCWRGRIDLYDSQGHFVGKAGVFSEEWKGEESNKYIVRYKPGTFLVEFSAYEFCGWVDYSQQDAFYGITQQGVEVYWGTAVDVSAQAVGGQFVNGLKGRLEKWDLGGAKEAYRLVFRNPNF